MRLQILDVADCYLRGRQVAALTGKTVEGEAVVVYVEDVPHSICVALAPGFPVSERVPEMIRSWNAKISERPHRCRTTSCACSSSDDDKKFKPNSIRREPCFRERCSADGDAIVGYDVFRARGHAGFEENEREFLRLRLSKSYFCGPLERILRREDFGNLPREHRGVYRKNDNAVSSFFHLSGLSGFAWCDVVSPRNEKKDASGRRVFEVDFSNVRPLEGAEAEEHLTKNAPTTVVFFDIETISPLKHGNSFADRDHPVGVLGLEISPSNRKIALALAGNSTREVDRSEIADDVEIEVFDDERDLLLRFRDLTREIDPDLFVGWNSNVFDTRYLFDRAKRLGILDEFDDLTRIAGERTILLNVEKSSKQKGGRSDTLVDCPGRIFYDLLNHVRDDVTLRLGSNKLGDVAEELGLGKKDDLEGGYEAIHPAFHGTAEERGRLVKYCLKDVSLTRKIFDKRGVLFDLRSKCRVAGIRGRDEKDTGLTRKLCQVFDAYAERMGIVRMTLEKGPDGKYLPAPYFDQIPGYSELYRKTVYEDFKYEGAYVLEPKRGIRKNPVMVFDFNSLYPSLIEAHNICFTTAFRSLEDALRRGFSRDQLHVCETTGVVFVKQSVRLGVVPAIVADLVAKRNELRARMTTMDKVSDEWASANALQNAYKVFANSFYGTLGSALTELCFLSAAMSITAYGQIYIKAVRSYLMESDATRKYGLDVVYGDTDSVFVETSKGGHDLDETRRDFAEIARLVNDESGIFSKPMKMGMDSLSECALILSKKMYVTVLISEKIGAPPKRTLYMKGVQAQKRDTVTYVGRTQRRIFEMLLYEKRPVEEIEDYVRNRMSDLLLGKVPRQELRMSKKLNKHPDDYPGNEAHVVAARQLISQDFDVRAGDRVDYYYCATANSHSKKKCDSVVAEELVAGFDLSWKEYAALMRTPLEKTLTEISGFAKADEILNPNTRYYRSVKPFVKTDLTEWLKLGTESKRSTSTGSGSSSQSSRSRKRKAEKDAKNGKRSKEGGTATFLEKWTEAAAVAASSSSTT